MGTGVGGSRRRQRRLWQTTPDLKAPDLLVPEVCNAVWRKVRLGEMQLAQATRVGARLMAGVVPLHPAAALASAALEIALALKHPAYDCFYIALAELDASEVVTADKKLLARVDGSSWASRVTAL
ncbi:MAG TPA: type II toxin-antitoxin system VapC family toxin [Geminicoccaceae bacterium]